MAVLPTPESGLNVTDPAPPEAESGTAGPPDGVAIRDLEGSDLPAVTEIERRSFASPWSMAMLALEVSRPSGVALVATTDGHVAGCSIATRYDQAWHLMKIAVTPEQRRCGLASSLLAATLTRIGPDAPVTLEVRPTNHAAIALYERFGFAVGGRRPAYYPDNGEDALIMWLGDPALAGVPAESMESARA